MDGSMPTPVSKAQDLDDLRFRQLKHQVKNSMQRIMNELGRRRVVIDSVHWRRMITDLQERVVLSSQLPDLLFDEVEMVDNFRQRIQTMGQTLIAVLGDEDQTIDFRVSVTGAVPRTMQMLCLRLAHEIVGNAVKHGMRERIAGRIWLDIIVNERLSLIVRNDGWPFMQDYCPGEGMELMRRLIANVDADIVTTRIDELTCVSVEMPLDRQI